MSWPLNPQNGQQITINGALYEYVSASSAWNRIGYVPADIEVPFMQVSELVITGNTNFTDITRFHIPGGYNNFVISTNGDGNLKWTPQLSSTPEGIDTSVQVNDNGVLFGSDAFTFNKNSNTLYAEKIEGTLTTPSQPNITSVGTLTSLTVHKILLNEGAVGNITADNANLGNLVKANYFKGTLDSTSSNQANITNIGTLKDLNITGGNISFTDANVSLNGTTLWDSDIIPTIWANGDPKINLGTPVNKFKTLYLSAKTIFLDDTAISTTDGSLTVTNSTTGEAVPFATTATLESTAVGVAPFTVASDIMVANLNADLLHGLRPFNGFVIDPLNPGLKIIQVVPDSIVALDADGNFAANMLYGNISGKAESANTVVQASQPSITSVGKLTSLAVGGNIDIDGNINSGNYIFAEGFIGDGYTLTNINGQNVSIVASATSAINSTTSSLATRAIIADSANIVNNTDQPNIWTLNNLRNVTIARDGTGNLVADNINSLGNSNAKTFYGNISAPTIIAGNIQSPGSTTQIVYNKNGNLAANTNLKFNDLTNELTVAGNVVIGSGTGGNILNANVISAQKFSGNGFLLSTLNGANVSTVATATYATSAGSADYATVAGSALVTQTVSNAAQPNITSVGTLTGLNVSTGNTAFSQSVVTGFAQTTSSTGGSLLAGTYYVRVIALDSLGGQTAPSVELTSTFNIGTTNQISLSWNSFPGAAQYRVWFLYFPQGETIPNPLVYQSTGSSGISANVRGGYKAVTGVSIYTLNNTTWAGGQISMPLTSTFVSGLGINYPVLLDQKWNNSSIIFTGLKQTIIDTASNVNSLLVDLQVDGVSKFKVDKTGNIITVANISAAFITGTIATATQTSITRVGTLLSLTVTGNTTSGNANLGNLTKSNYFSGVFDTLSNAQPNIKSVGTLTSLTVANTGSTGNITADNANLGNLTKSNYFSGVLDTLSNAQPNIKSVGTLTNLTVANTGATGNITADNANLGNLVTANNFTGNIISGTSNIRSVTNGNISFSVGGAANILVLTSTTGNISNLIIRSNLAAANANFTASLITKDFTANTGIITENDPATFQQEWNSSTTVFTGILQNVTNTDSAAGSKLIDLQIDGSSKFSVSKEGNLVTGNANLGNLAKSNYFSGNGIYLESLTGGNVTGHVPNATHACTANTVTNSTQSAITRLGTLTQLDVTGEFGLAGNATITGNLTVTGTTIYANITTLNVKDPTIELGGNPTGTALTTSDGKDRGSILHYYKDKAIDAFMGWDSSKGEFGFGSNVVITDNEVTSWNEYGNLRANVIKASLLLGTIGAPGADKQLVFNDGGNANAVSGLTFDKSTTFLNLDGNIKTSNANLGNLATANFFTGTLINGTSNVRIISSAPNDITISAGGTSNVVVISSTLANITGNLAVSANANVGNLGTTGLIVATGNITGGNLITGGLASITGNVTGGNLITLNLVSGGTAAITGNANVGNLGTTGLVVATGNVTGGNLITGGLLNVTGNITGGNLITGGLASVTGNVTGGNLITAGLASVTGNITGGNLISSGLASVTGNITGGNLITGGLASVTGNVTGGNLITGGLASVTGNVTGGNLITGGLANVTGNVIGGNLITSGLASVTGNVIGGNLITSGLASVTGNITGGNLNTANLVSGGSLLISANANVTGNMNVTANANITANVNANNITLTNTVTANAANIKYLNLDTGSLSTSAPLILNQTWNNASATFTGIRENITDTASASGSMLLDLQVGSVSRANITKAGNLFVQNANLGNLTTANYIAIGQTGTAIIASTPATFVQAWNNASVTFTGIQQNITDTASASGSMLLDLQVGGTSRANITKAGNLFVQNANLGNLAVANFVNVSYSTQLTSSIPSQFNQIWNNSSASFTALQQNVTDTASAAGSKLLDLQVGGASRFTVTKEGNTTAVNSSLGNLATANYITVSGSGSITTSTPSRFIQAWNGAGTTVFDTVIANISTSNTTSSPDSTLMHLQHTDTTSTVTTYSRFKVDRTGNAIANAFVATTGTLTANRPALNLTQTWNNASATFTGIVFDATDTASSTNSKLIDLKQNGVTKFAVSKIGGITFGGSALFGPTADIMATLASGTTGAVVHDYQNCAVFYHPSPAGTITVALNNVPTDVNRIMVISVLLQQGTTPYIIGGLTIREVGSTLDVAQTIKWLNNVTPVGSASSLDVFGFTLLRTAGGAWVVTGSQASYG